MRNACRAGARGLRGSPFHGLRAGGTGDQQGRSGIIVRGIMQEEDVLAEFRASQALLEGHFLLSSGRHSAFYCNARAC
jgi:hypothetical protein